jgi:hypothetical protein
VVGGSEAQQGWSLHAKQSSKHTTLFCGVKQSSDVGVCKSKPWWLVSIGPISKGELVEEQQISNWQQMLNVKMMHH